ncbi:polyhydroxyalkanoic acid synthase (plasmid) [Burkholderia thailandensis]|uniref:PHA/PHB synthase family protein n=1 Tax=Burkholderia thailandensis TaxID=57975 RepID=UPI00192D8524|nr:alpha/beta fold hydrolase [Burkholderia thailandensis]MBS2132162.1 polyhydroxyalkanoic acid synthase [Burkholderia thailandensis]QRA15265.1 polyhydroxyalkanoic acid synthase [Burkholderia thailandensis]
MSENTASPGDPREAATRRLAGFDPPFHAAIARYTSGLSPLALSLACADWWQHLSLSPDKQIELAQKAWRQWQRLLAYCSRAVADSACVRAIEPLPQDTRFADAAWGTWPFNVSHQAFLLGQQWWHHATTDVPGESPHHEDVLSFAVRQMLDVASPSNFPLLNPQVIERTWQQAGTNYAQGALNFWQDAQRLMTGERPVGAERFKVGRDVAASPGKVVFRNRLIELIQYTPASETVSAEPVLIVPAWIMKYYILDLSPDNSLVRYLIENGHTVFMISWKNPGEADEALGMEDYRRLGIMEALDAVSAIVPAQRIHTVGYCLGGTLLSIAAAAMARDSDARLASITLFAAQTDFTEAGELTLFIDEDQVRFLEDMMAEQGYLDARQMAGAFQLLRSNDLIWSAMVSEYLMGERRPIIDLMAWNADTTRMPARMHTEYLRHLFLNNDLAEGRYEAGGKPVALRDIRVPVFAVSTIRDHVAPWRSVYKIQMLTDADVTFVLSNGGHNAGIVNPPGHPHSRHQIATHKESETYVDPDAWQAAAVHHERSWWPCWLEWLARHNSEKVSPPAMGARDKGYPPLDDAPGLYVLES